MKTFIIITFCLLLFSCSNFDTPTLAIKETDSTNLYSDHWFTNSNDFDSSSMNKITANIWLLLQSNIIPDSIEIIDLSNCQGLIFKADTSIPKRTLLKFNSDFTVTELRSKTNDKWNVIHKKNINIKWDKSINTDLSGQYSIAYLKNERLHLFRGSHKKKNKTIYIFGQITY